MPLLSDLDSIDLAILKVIARQPEILTRDIESTVYLSRTQVLRRLQRLEERELITKSGQGVGVTFRYSLSGLITAEDVEQENQARLLLNRDPIAREALSLLLQGVQGFCDSVGAATNHLSEVVGRIEAILK